MNPQQLDALTTRVYKIAKQLRRDQLTDRQAEYLAAVLDHWEQHAQAWKDN